MSQKPQPSSQLAPLQHTQSGQGLASVRMSQAPFNSSFQFVQTIQPVQTVQPLLPKFAETSGFNIAASPVIQYSQDMPPIKGDSRIEYVPYEKTIIEYEEVKRMVQIPQTHIVTDYYAVEFITEYIPFIYKDTIIEYVPVDTYRERVEYQKVEKQIVHPPAQQSVDQLMVQPVIQSKVKQGVRSQLQPIIQPYVQQPFVQPYVQQPFVQPYVKQPYVQQPYVQQPFVQPNVQQPVVHSVVKPAMVQSIVQTQVQAQIRPFLQRSQIIQGQTFNNNKIIYPQYPYSHHSSQVYIYQQYLRICSKLKYKNKFLIDPLLLSNLIFCQIRTQIMVKKESHQIERKIIKNKYHIYKITNFQMGLCSGKIKKSPLKDQSPKQLTSIDNNEINIIKNKAKEDNTQDEQIKQNIINDEENLKNQIMKESNHIKNIHINMNFQQECLASKNLNYAIQTLKKKSQFLQSIQISRAIQVGDHYKIETTAYFGPCFY